MVKREEEGRDGDGGLIWIWIEFTFSPSGFFVLRPSESDRH